MTPILLIGAGGHTKSCIDVIEKEKKFHILGLIGHREEVGDSILGYKIIGTDEDLPHFRRSLDFAFVTIGQIKTANVRMKFYFRLKELGFVIPVIQSPHAIVSVHAQIGEGTIVHHGAIVNSDVKIGVNCIINSGALIEHDCMIGDHTHVATRSVLNGNVVVGNETFIGSNTVVKNGISIGNQCVVGMGLSIKKNLSSLTNFSK